MKRVFLSALCVTSATFVLSESSLASPYSIDLSARNCWQDTAITLEKGTKFSVQASGTWTNGGIQPYLMKANGFDHSRENSLVSSAPFASLVGKVGNQTFSLNGGDYESGVTWTSNEAGNLFLSINDVVNTCSDNSGVLKTNIKILGRQFNVDSRDTWVDTGIDLKKGTHISIRAKGKWTNGSDNPQLISADGYIAHYRDDALAPELPFAALIGKIGDEVFAIGDSFDDPVPGSGRLYVQINDVPGTLDDNSGLLNVDLSLNPSLNLKAKTDGKYGEYGSNISIPDVEEAFNKASGSRKKKHKFHFSSRLKPINEVNIDKFHIKDHIQSIARLPGVGNENYVALSRSARDKGDGAVYLVNFDEINSNGEAWKWAEQRTSDSASSFYYYKIPTNNHPGGMQALGGMLFIANGGKGNANITVMDVRDPANAKLINNFEIDGSQGELEPNKFGGKQVRSDVSAVAAIRLQDGRHLIFVNGVSSNHVGWFFVTDETDPEKLGKANWTLVDTWSKEDLPPGTPWEDWENVNFIGDSKTGEIYMVGMGTSHNRSFLYKLTVDDSVSLNKPNLNFKFVKGRGLNVTGLSDNEILSVLHPSVRWGAGIHITPTHNIVSYVTSRHGESIEEFRHH